MTSQSEGPRRPAVKRKAVGSRSTSLQTQFSPVSTSPVSTSQSLPQTTNPAASPVVVESLKNEWSPFQADQISASILPATATPLVAKPPVNRASTVPPKLPPDNALRQVNRARLERPMSNHDLTAKLGWGKKVTKVMDTMIPYSHEAAGAVSGPGQRAVQGTVQKRMSMPVATSASEVVQHLTPNKQTIQKLTPSKQTVQTALSIGGKAVDWAKRNPRATRMIIRTGLKMMNNNDSGDYGDMDFGGGDSGIDLSGGFDTSAFDASDLGGGGVDMSGMDFSGGVDMSGMDFSGGGVDTGTFDASGMDFTGGGIHRGSFDVTGGLTSDFSGGADITDNSSQTTFDVSGATDFTSFGLDNTAGDGTGFDYSGMDTTGDASIAFDNSDPGASVSADTWGSGINADFGLTSDDNTFVDDTATGTGIDDSCFVPDFAASDDFGDTANDTGFTSGDFGSGDFSATSGFGDDGQLQGQDDSANIGGDDTFAVENDDGQGSGLGEFDGSIWDQDDGTQDQGQDDANDDVSDNDVNGNDDGMDLGTNDDSGTYDDSGNYDDSMNQDDDNLDTSQFDDNNNPTDQNGDSQPQTTDSINNDNDAQENQTKPPQNQQSHSQNRPQNRPQHRPQSRPQNRPSQHRPSQPTHKPTTNHQPTISKPRPPNQHLQARPSTVPPPQQAHRPTRPQQVVTPRPRPQSTIAMPQTSPHTGPGLPITPSQAGMMPLTSAQPIMVPMTYLDPTTGEQKMILVPMTPMIGATGGMQMQLMPVAQGISQAQTQVQNQTRPNQTQMRPTKPVPARRQPATTQIPATSSQSHRNANSGGVQSSQNVIPAQSNVKPNRKASAPAKPASPSTGLQPAPLQSAKQTLQQSHVSNAPLRTRMVSLPVLDIQSPYHAINREMMARILAGKQASHKPPHKPPTTNNTTAQSTVLAPSQGSLSPTPSRPVGTHSQRRRPPQPTTPLPPPSILKNPQHPISNLPGSQPTGPTRRLLSPQTQPFHVPSTQNTAEQFRPQSQRDDSSDDATTSTVDIYDTPRDDVFDARPGNEADHTEYVSYEDALRFSPMAVSGDTISSPEVTASVSGKMNSVENNESQSSEVHQEDSRIEVTEQIQAEESIVSEENPVIQGQTVQTTDGTEVDSFNNASANYDEVGDSTETAMMEIDSMMDLDEFNKEIEEARLLRLAQLQPQNPAVEEKFVPETEESLVEPEEVSVIVPEEETVIVEKDAEALNEEFQGTQAAEVEADEPESIGSVDENAGVGLYDV